MNMPLEVSYSSAKSQLPMHPQKPLLGNQVGLQWCISVTQNLNLNEVWIHLDKELSAPFQGTALVG